MKHLLILFIFSLLTSCSYQSDAANPTKLAPKCAQAKMRMRKDPPQQKLEVCLPIRKETLSLGKVIDLGMKNNPKTSLTWAQAQVAATLYGQSLAPFFPEINLYGNFSNVQETLQEGNLFLGYKQTTVNPEMQIQYILFDFGERTYVAQTALLNLHYSNYTHNREVETILMLLISDYFDYLYQKEALLALESDLLSSKATVEAAEEKKKTGVASIADVVQAQTQYLQTKLVYIGQKKDLEAAYAKLAKDMGIPSNFPFKTETFPTFINSNLPIQNLNSLIAFAKSHRQDYMAVNANKESKVYAVESAIAEQRPHLVGNFNIGKDYYSAEGKGQHHSFGSEEPYHYTAKLTLSYPLFAGYFYRNLIKMTKAGLKEAEARVKGVELDMIEQVTTSHFNLKMAKETLETSNSYLDSAKVNFDIALTNYKAGTDTILDVLAAQSALADARAQLASAKNTWFTSLADLAYATGSLTKQTVVP